MKTKTRGSNRLYGFDDDVINDDIRDIDFSQYPYNFIFDIYDMTFRNYMTGKCYDLDDTKKYYAQIGQVMPTKKEIFSILMDADTSAFLSKYAPYLEKEYSGKYSRKELKNDFGLYNRGAMKTYAGDFRKMFFLDLIAGRVNEDTYEFYLKQPFKETLIYQYGTFMKICDTNKINESSTVKDIIDNVIAKAEVNRKYWKTNFRGIGMSYLYKIASNPILCNIVKYYDEDIYYHLEEIISLTEAFNGKWS
jgi:hypothetical protein